MAKSKDRFGSIGVPHGTSAETQFQMGAVTLRSSSKWRRLVARLFWIVPIIAMILALIISVNHGRMAKENAEITQSQLTESYNPGFKVRYEDLGRQIITSWYSHEEPPIDVGKEVEWPSDDSEDSSVLISNVALIDGQRNNLITNSETKDIEGYDEVLTYRATMEGDPVSVSVTLHSSNGDGDPYPVLVSTPTIKPLEETVERDVSAEPTELDEIELSPEAIEQIDTWARAWTMDDRRSLKQIVADTDPGRMYAGLGQGWSVPEESEVRVDWQRKRKGDSENYIIASVSFDITKSIDTGEVDEEKKPVYRELGNTQTMELLIGDYESGIPTILAWGESGSWNELEPHGNSYVPAENSDDSRVPEEQEPTEMPTNASTENPEPEETETPKPKEGDK